MCKGGIDSVPTRHVLPGVRLLGGGGGGGGCSVKKGLRVQIIPSLRCATSLYYKMSAQSTINQVGE